MSDVTQVLNNIKKAVSGQHYGTIIKSLCALQTKKKFQHLSDSEFFDIVGETFKLDPDYFMRGIYNPFRKKMNTIIGSSKLKEMEEYIIQKFCLYEGEQILYECEGTIKNAETAKRDKSGKYKGEPVPPTVFIRSARLFFTNYRIIAQGKLKVSGGQNLNYWVWGLNTFFIYSGGSKRAESKKKLIESAPLYGYNFQIKNHFSLTKVVKLFRSIMYRIMIDDRICLISINPDYSLHLDKIFELLRKDVSQVLNLIDEVNKTEMLEEDKQKAIVSILEALRTSEEFQQFSDSDFYDIVGETFKLDPEFFMKSVYPQMMSWDFSSFLSVKEETISLVNKLSQEFDLTKG